MKIEFAFIQFRDQGDADRALDLVRGISCGDRRIEAQTARYGSEKMKRRDIKSQYPSNSASVWRPRDHATV